MSRESGYPDVQVERTSKTPPPQTVASQYCGRDIDLAFAMHQVGTCRHRRLASSFREARSLCTDIWRLLSIRLAYKLLIFLLFYISQIEMLQKYNYIFQNVGFSQTLLFRQTRMKKIIINYGIYILSSKINVLIEWIQIFLKKTRTLNLIHLKSILNKDYFVFKLYENVVFYLFLF